MALIRWEPVRELNSIQSEMNRLFNTFFDTPTTTDRPARRWIPAMDLVENGDDYVLRADLPGEPTLTLTRRLVHIARERLRSRRERRPSPP